MGVGKSLHIGVTFRCWRIQIQGYDLYCFAYIKELIDVISVWSGVLLHNLTLANNLQCILCKPTRGGGGEGVVCGLDPFFIPDKSE